MYTILTIIPTAAHALSSTQHYKVGTCTGLGECFIDTSLCLDLIYIVLGAVGYLLAPTRV